MPPTLADIARACSLSLATVSKALSPHRDRCDLSTATRERVLAAARRLGWSRDRGRSARARRRWRNIGMLWGLRTPFTRGGYEGVPEAVATALGDDFRLLITPTPLPRDWSEVQMSLHLDGVITLGGIDDGILADLEARDYPAVLVNHRSPRRLPQFLADDLGGALALARHLADLGHRRLVYLGNDWVPSHHSEPDRRAGVARVAAERGLAVADVHGPRYDQVVAHCRAGATAVVCYNWWDVSAVLAALRAAGLAVPRAVSVAACHDLSWFPHFDPAVTAVAVPVQRLAEDATRLLLDLIAGAPPAPGTVLPETLVVRASTAPPGRPRRR
jgi:DNA-binding LacI/PurR family transcriptional regulator